LSPLKEFRFRGCSFGSAWLGFGGEGPVLLLVLLAVLFLFCFPLACCSVVFWVPAVLIFLPSHVHNDGTTCTLF
jgi:hypothetical protein